MRTCRVIMITTAAICTVLGSIADDNAGPADRMPPAVANLDNYTVKLQGKYPESTPVDLVLTGSGPEFSIELADSCLSFRATLQPDGDRVRIKYELSVEALIPRGTRLTGGGPGNKMEQVPNIEICRLGVRGSAVLSSGKPLAIVTVNQNKLELTVTKSTEEASPRK